MGTSLSLIWSGVPDTQDTWGLQQETRDLGGGWGGHNRGTQEDGSDKRDGPTRLSKVVAVFVVQGVEQVQEVAKGSGEREQDTYYAGNRP
jgi:hypothetical protein